MTSHIKIGLLTALAALLSSGCCLTTSCGVGGVGCGIAPGAASCGAAGYGAAPGCGVAPDCGGCDSCGGGPVIPCRSGQHGGCLGLKCIGKLFNIASYGCLSGCGGGCGGGCGETYYHDWISDPPCPDPCDGCGNWNGAGSCAGGACGSGVGAVGCGVSSCGGGCADGCAVGPAPGCGAAMPAMGCGVSMHGGGRTAFSLPGRALYSTWMGMGGVLRGIRYGFLPKCRSCNAFSTSDYCGGCAGGMSVAGPSCGCAGVTMDGCSTCGVASTGTVVHSNVVHHGGSNQFATGQLASHQLSPGRVPHQVTRQIRTAHGRPPHKVVADRMR